MTCPTVPDETPDHPVVLLGFRSILFLCPAAGDRVGVKVSFRHSGGMGMRCSMVHAPERGEITFHDSVTTPTWSRYWNELVLERLCEVSNNTGITARIGGEEASVMFISDGIAFVAGERVVAALQISGTYGNPQDAPGRVVDFKNGSQTPLRSVQDWSEAYDALLEAGVEISFCETPPLPSP